MSEAGASDASDAAEIARRLIARAAATGDARDSALAVRVACEQAFRDLTHSLGVNGFQALLARAMTQVQGVHPSLLPLRVGRQLSPSLEGLGQSIEAHGTPAVVAGLDALLEALLALLGRLIGTDMVARLVEHGATVDTYDEDTT